MRSYLSHLECTACGVIYPARRLMNTCEACGRVLFYRYDLAGLAERDLRPEWARRPAGLWRFYELLPLDDPGMVVSLGEGGTPLLPLRRLGRLLGLERLFLKDESFNPTGTFKARGMAVAVSRARELGADRFVLPSAGNAAGALAVYGARAGVECVVVVPRSTPQANLKEASLAGARVLQVEGHIGDAGRRARRLVEEGFYDLSTLREPFRVEGKKTMGIEIAQDLGWRLPDVVVYPTGGGTGIVGMWKAFQELRELGWVEGDMPRFVAVQAEGCQPIVTAFHQGLDTAEPWPDPRTVASGLRVPHPFADYLILRALRESRGTALAVSDREILQAMRDLALYEGVVACPEGSATLAGLRRLVDEGWLDDDETVVLLNTGSGLKYLDLINP